MIKMVKAKDLTLGMKLSTDGLVIRRLQFFDYNPNKIIAEGISHGIWKDAVFWLEDELPIYYDDSNSGED